MVFYLPKRGKRGLLAPMNYLFVIMFLFIVCVIKRDDDDGGGDIKGTKTAGAHAHYIPFHS